MSIVRTLAVLSALIITSPPAYAGIEEGDKTLSVFIDLSSDSFGDETYVALSGGYFVTDTLELQGVVLFIESEDDQFGDVESLTGFGLNANLYFPLGNPDLVPYIGAGADLLETEFNNVSESDSGFNAQIGIKHFAELRQFFVIPL